ncbi:MAG: hypothetical protein JSS02_08910, partial [Planctomycetes bacterium]|nr:hypothetical protein [Planctomycetota bacterium]
VGSLAALRAFEDLAAPRGTGYRLADTQFPDQSRICLDSRGLLHFQSSDPSVPEFSLVLAEKTFTGWCADGRVWGDPYFLGDVSRTEPAVIFETLIQPFLRRLS